MQLRISLAKRLGQSSIVNAVGHADILAQSGYGFAWLVRLVGFGQCLIVIANGTLVAYLTFQVDSPQQYRHSFGTTLHVEQVVGYVFQTDSQQVAIGHVHALYILYSLLRRRKSTHIVTLTIIGIAEL